MSRLKKIKSNIAHNLLNARGWHTRRKIVVFESDDWGSVRMPSRPVYEYFLKNKISLDKCPYNKYDSLASSRDLEALFETLKQYRDINGNSPVITANTVMANPDFEKIRKDNFNKYHFEIFTETLKKYPEHSQSFDLWKQGIRENIFSPQLHGREHLNVKRWLYALQREKEFPVTKMAFDNSFFGINAKIANENRKNYMPFLDLDSSDDIIDSKEKLAESISLFKEIFGYNSKTFIAPSYTWHKVHEDILSEREITCLQSNPYQKSPLIEDNGSEDYKYIYHYSGQKSNSGVFYNVRNAYFEPSQTQDNQELEKCLRRINIAFKWNKPAIICTHRINFIGFINETNRDHNLKLLNRLILEILKKWPETEFMSSAELFDTMNQSSVN